MSQETKADYLRKLVTWANNQRESLLDDLSVQELCNVFDAARASDWDLPNRPLEPGSTRAGCQAWDAPGV